MGYIVLSPEYLPYISTIVNFIISFTPLLSYGSTVLSIRKKQSSQGFSIDICATMLIASILRIFYYFNDPFEATLLRQCFVMVFIQTILLKVALKYRSEDAVHFETYQSNWNEIFEKYLILNKETIDETFETYNIGDNYRDYEILDVIKGAVIVLLKCTYLNLLMILTGLVQVVKDIVRLFDYHYKRPFNFWQWQDSFSYWKFLIGLVGLLTLLQLIFMGNEYLGITFGTISFMVESSLPLPQVLLFQRLKSVENFKTILLLSWLGGDFTKISYLFFGTDNVGYIFILAAFFQMSLNFVITYQFFYYRHMEAREMEIPMTHYPGTVHSNESHNSNNYSNEYNGAVPFLSNSEKNTVSQSRAASISLNGLISKSNNINVVPQNQHYQPQQAKTNNNKVGSDDLDDGIEWKKDETDNYTEDEMATADGIPSEMMDFGHHENSRRTTSIDFDSRRLSIGDETGRGEHVRSKAGSLNTVGNNK